MALPFIAPNLALGQVNGPTHRCKEYKYLITVVSLRDYLSSKLTLKEMETIFENAILEAKRHFPSVSATRFKITRVESRYEELENVFNDIISAFDFILSVRHFNHSNSNFKKAVQMGERLKRVYFQLTLKAKDDYVRCTLQSCLNRLLGMEGFASKKENNKTSFPSSFSTPVPISTRSSSASIGVTTAAIVSSTSTASFTTQKRKFTPLPFSFDEKKEEGMKEDGEEEDDMEIVQCFNPIKKLDYFEEYVASKQALEALKEEEEEKRRLAVITPPSIAPDLQLVSLATINLSPRETSSSSSQDDSFSSCASLFSPVENASCLLSQDENDILDALLQSQ